jgi:hypothetical protein
MSVHVEGLNGKSGAVVDWAVAAARILTPLLLTGMSFLWWNHETRLQANTVGVQVMSSNRFTSEDGLEVWRAISVIQSALDTKAEAIGAVPVRSDIQEIKRRLEALETEVRRGYNP